MRCLPAIVALLVSSPAAAQSYKPFPEARVTDVQWQAYYEEVSTKLGASRKEEPGQGLVVFSNRETGTFYAFTLPGNPAHPAWVTRQVFEAGGSINIQQIGYFAGDEAAFAKLFRAYQQLNDKIRQEMDKRR
jgi:hypothetical protein